MLKKPIVVNNCHIKVGTKTIDFFPQKDDKMFQNKFVEYHPWDRKLTQEEYRKRRQEAINNSIYKGTDLIIIDNSKFLKQNRREENGRR